MPDAERRLPGERRERPALDGPDWSLSAEARHRRVGQIFVVGNERTPDSVILPPLHPTGAAEYTVPQGPRRVNSSFGRPTSHRSRPRITRSRDSPEPLNSATKLSPVVCGCFSTPAAS